MAFMSKELKKKPLPIGLSDFKMLRDEGCLYVDKSLFIQEVLEKGTRAALFMRPRRFGKTLNLSMLYYFFSKSNEDTSYLFKDLFIWNFEQYRGLQGKFPVVFISLKDIKYTTLERTLQAFRKLIAKEYEQHTYLLQGDILSPKERCTYDKIVNEEEDPSLLEDSLQLLSEWLHRYHKQKVILLIDEYDAPMHKAFLNHFYKSIIDTWRTWMSKSFKDNRFMERCVLTGVLRVAKESMFSGANNIKVFSFVNDLFSEQFGFLESEVNQLIKDYDITHLRAEIQRWYNGYRVGENTGIYNPWSVLNCINDNGQFLPYWNNTGDIELIDRLVARGSDGVKIDLETLLQNGTIEKTLREGITFSVLDKDAHSLWSMLLYSGYLSIHSSPSFDQPCKLHIPNHEVEIIFRQMVENWFYIGFEETKYRQLLSSLIRADIATFSKLFQEFMLSAASVFDIPFEESEKIYHMFVLGMLVGLQDHYSVKSNKESGLGRYDVMLIPKNPKDLGVIMEFKKTGSADPLSLEAAMASALRQIEEKQYAQELLDRGISRILYLGFAFKGKQVLIGSKMR